MIISEFLPNPIGKDTEGEWIKLFNDGNEIVNLSGWRLEDAAGEKFIFRTQKIEPAQSLTLNYKITKISLNNDGETLLLYDPANNLITKARFTGKAPEGAVLIKKGSKFIFNDNAGLANQPQFDASVPINQPTINSEGVMDKIIPTSSFTHLFIGIFLAMILALFFSVVVKKYNLLSNQ